VIDPQIGAIISLGPISIPLWGIVLIVSYVGGQIALRLSLRDERHIRGEIADRMSIAILIDILVWKLAPVVSQPSIIIARPLYLLYATGGTGAALLGGVAALVYLAITTRTWWRDAERRLRLRGVLWFAVVAIGIIAVGMLLPAFIGGSPSGGPQPGATDSITGKREMRAPDFALVDLDGETVSLAELAGRTVVLNFWASWCPPCRAELPILVGFARETDPDHIALVSINQTTSERSLDALRSFVAEEEIRYPVLLDGTNRTFFDYGVRGIPTTFVISPEGFIVKRRSGVVTPSWLSRLE